MDLLENLFYGFPDLWGGGVAHTFLVISLTIALGLSLGKIKVAKVSLGLAWVLFIGILFGYLGFNIDAHILHYMKEFGLVLFVYSIGMQAGPSFFSSFTKGGLSLNMLTLTVILLSIITTIGIHFLSGTPITTMAGILSGAVTNTPGLGAAQQAYSYLSGIDAPDIAVGYSVAYPIGVLGMMLCFVILRYVLRINKEQEEQQAERGLGHLEDLTVRPFSILVNNDMIDGKNIKEIRDILNRKFVVSRIVKKGTDNEENLVNGSTTIEKGDRLLVISSPKDVDPIIALLGQPDDFQWEKGDGSLVSRRVLITRPEINGQTLAQLKIRSNLGANITRVNRSGVDLVATPNLKLQLGDKLTVVGTELAISHVEKLLGNQLRRLNYPNLVPIFLGIALGCIVANIPIPIPGIPEAVRLGLTGGPLVVAILIGYFGPKYHLVTYNTISANLMIREVGICLFLACVGIGAGKDFFSTIVTSQGLTWIAYGALITLIPILIGGLIGRYLLHLNFYTLLGVLSGANTNPPALSYAASLTSSDSPSVSYATVYPFAMFMRIITIQIMVMALA
ncbi:MAG: putative transporter [Prevotella sp.]|jgi:putative transport protein